MTSKRPSKHAKVWPALRLAVYEASGWRCVICGIGPGQRPEGYDGSYAIVVRERHRLTGSVAQRSRKTWDTLEMDHVQAYANGGSHKAENRQALCTLCNLRKGCS